MFLVPANKVEKIKYFSTLLGLIFIEITRGPFHFYSNPFQILVFYKNTLVAMSY